MGAAITGAVYGTAATLTAASGIGTPVAIYLGIAGAAHSAFIGALYSYEADVINSVVDEISWLVNGFDQEQVDVTWDSYHNTITVCGTTDGGCVSIQFNISTTVDMLDDWFYDFYGEPNTEKKTSEDDKDSEQEMK